MLQNWEHAREEMIENVLFEIAARCNIKQYRVLKRCSDRKDVSRWNNWRKRHPNEEIYLQGAYLPEANLQGAYLFGANLHAANLRGANLHGAHLERADLLGVHLERADLGKAHLQGASVWNANLQGADFSESNLQGAKLIAANLQGAKLGYANLQGASLFITRLRRTDFSAAIVDGQTLIWAESIDKDTNFRSVGLNSARLQPGLKQTLQYIVRKEMWGYWYDGGSWPVRFLKRLVIQSFWGVSDYGRSTVRIIITFFGLAVLFAAIYCCLPDCLMVRGGKLTGFLHAIYFSIVTMTTLGFGDIYANPKCPAGQIVLIFHVLLGYVLLAALVTRLAVLFTADGPAVEFWRKRGKIKECRIKIRWCARRAKRRLFQS